MKSSHQSTSEIKKVSYLNKILGLVVFVGSVKVALLVGILFMPSDMPEFEFTTLIDAITERTSPPPTDEELRTIARLEAQNNLPDTVRQTLQSEIDDFVEDTTSAEEDESSPLFGVSVAYAAEAHAVENIPPVPSATAAIPNPSPLIPQIQPMNSPIAVENFQRPDSATAGIIPAPNVQNPYMSTDTYDIQQEELNRREQELRALEEQVQARMNELRGIEGEVGEMIDTAESVDDANYAQLVDMYVNMKPRQAAIVLADLDENVAVKILAGMKGQEAGDILSYMVPNRAVVLSELLASIAR